MMRKQPGLTYVPSDILLHDFTLFSPVTQIVRKDSSNDVYASSTRVGYHPEGAHMKGPSYKKLLMEMNG
jgi:hypothetical protein